jgi:hypothetical protein
VKKKDDSTGKENKTSSIGKEGKDKSYWKRNKNGHHRERKEKRQPVGKAHQKFKTTCHSFPLNQH